MFARFTHRAPVRIVAPLALVALTAGIAVSYAPAPARAAEQPFPVAVASGELIAADHTPEVLPLVAVPAAPGALAVTTEPGATVTVSARGTKARTVRANKGGHATLKKLHSGQQYTIRSAGHSITATPITTVTPAAGLRVFTTDSADSVSLTWKHSHSAKQGAVSFHIKAEEVSQDAKAELHVVEADSSTTDALLSGLNPDLLYSFTVTPFNALGNGKATTAVMDKSLAELNPRTAVTENAPVVQPVAQTPAQPQSQPQPQPQPQRPSTRTIYVCPSGYVDSGDRCSATTPYTYHEEVEARAYTYHNESYQITVNDPGPVYAADTAQSQGTPCPWGGSLNSEGDLCLVPGSSHTETRTRSVRDSTPVGFTDTGNNWERTTQVMDNPPVGYSDTGAEWITYTAKVAQVVSA